MTTTRRKPAPASGEEFGVFTRDGSTVTAYSAEEAVRYRFDGWQQSVPAAEENREEPADTPTGPSADDPA